jgi:hypothetical protein
MLSPSQTCVSLLAGPLRFFGSRQPVLGNQFGDLAETLRVARHQKQQQAGNVHPGESVQDQCFLAFASAGGEPDRTATEQPVATTRPAAAFLVAA